MQEDRRLDAYYSAANIVATLQHMRDEIDILIRSISELPLPPPGGSVASIPPMEKETIADYADRLDALAI